MAPQQSRSSAPAPPSPSPSPSRLSLLLLMLVGGGCLIGVALTISAPVAATAAASASSSSGGAGASSSTTATSGGRLAAGALGLSATAAAARQSAVGVLGALGSLVPGLITNVAPLVLLFGLGAMLMPALSSLNAMGAIGAMRSAPSDARRSAHFANAADQFNPLASAAQLQAAGMLLNPAQLARPMQSSPQDLYYFSRRSFADDAADWPAGSASASSSAGALSAALGVGLRELFERVNRAIENADKRYN